MVCLLDSCYRLDYVRTDILSRRSPIIVRPQRIFGQVIETAILPKADIAVVLAIWSAIDREAVVDDLPRYCIMERNI